MRIEALWYADADIRAPIHDASAATDADAHAHAADNAPADADVYATDDPDEEDDREP